MDKFTNNDIDALIQIAKTKSTEPAKDLSSVEQWIISVGVKPGDYFIKPYELWSAYEEWAQYPVPQHEFFKQFKNSFKGERKRTQFELGYLVDPSPFDTTQDERFRLAAKRRLDRKRRADGKKAKGQTPSSES